LGAAVFLSVLAIGCAGIVAVWWLLGGVGIGG
jgi:hypothetical protein